MRAEIYKYYDFLARVGILLKGQHDPAIVLNPTGPQSLQFPLKLMRLQCGLEWVARQPFHNVKDGLR